MPQGHQKGLRALHFFKRMKAASQVFTVKELMDETQWSKSTVLTYLSKKWARHIERRGERLRVTGFDGFTEADFIALQTQKAD